MSLPTSQGFYRAEPAFADRLRAAGLPDAMSVFEHPKIEVWRSITERDNCVLDDTGGRLHIKRNKPGHRGVDDEVDGIRLLANAGIGTVPLAAAGRLNDGRGFLITDDLTGFADSEVLVKDGLPFETLLQPTAVLAGKLHAAGLHHRDLYLCHFYSNRSDASSWRGHPAHAFPPEHNAGGMPALQDTPIELRLMDAGRVRPLPRWRRQRWVVKDVAQFLYSLRQFDVEETMQGRWLSAYSEASGIALNERFRRAVERKVAWIGRHDANLRRRQPTRNVAIDR